MGMDLDDIEGIERVDRGGMLDVIEKFPEQVEEAIKIGKDALSEIKQGTFKNIKNVIITGMGGSAIGGEMIASLFKKESRVPIIVNRGYELPSFAGKETLLIAVSYSGNTEETLSCFKEAINNECKTISISSGGKLERMAEHADFHIKIPAGMQPRAALAYLLFPQIEILGKAGIIKKVDVSGVKKTLSAMRDRMKKDVPSAENPAKRIAMRIEGTAIIYGHGFMEAAATRWRQQLNENAKMMAFDFGVPEANHNELMAWEGIEESNGLITCIFLRHENESEQIKKRFDFMKKIYEKYADGVEIFADGGDEISRLMSVVYMGDYVSNYCALLRDIDPTPVSLIQKLKKKL